MQFHSQISDLKMSVKGSFHQAKIMGILNVTEDSFSDGGQFIDPSAAVSQARSLIREGADILDIGAESTRPGSTGVSPQLQWERIKPVLSNLAHDNPGYPISIDTQSAEVAAEAIALGAAIINDISALRHDPQMASVLAEHPKVKLVLMHMQGTPQSMQKHPHYEDLFGEILDFFRDRIDYAACQGIDPSRIILDPGIGFGKNTEHNLKLLAGLDRFRSLGSPLLLGASRKRFIDFISPSPEHQRVGGSLASTFVACQSGVDIIRVHDVHEHRQFMEVLTAIYGMEK
jgi:dihydropteroate synthase